MNYDNIIQYKYISMLQLPFIVRHLNLMGCTSTDVYCKGQ